MELFIKTLAGLEEILATELQTIGAEDISIQKRAVYCKGDLRLVYRANLELRTAIRVLVPISSFRLRDEDDLYKEIQKINWSEYLKPEGRLAIDAVTFFKPMDHSRYLALKTKDAIVDQFRDKYGTRPDVDLKNPDLRIHLHLDSRGNASLSLDSSGDGLHRRGYRTATTAAPLNEVLAAGLIMISGWEGDSNFVDPMCGSGTLLIEAAYIARRIPPNWYRKKFGFTNWPNFDADLWDNVRKEASQHIRPLSITILGGDRFHKAITVSKDNLKAAGIKGVELEKLPFERLTLPEAPGIIITNPPYDERMRMDDIGGLYQALGDKLKKEATGYTAWIFSGNIDALKRIALKPSKKVNLFNGPLACKYYRYDLYAGTKRKRKRIKRSEL